MHTLERQFWSLRRVACVSIHATTVFVARITSFDDSVIIRCIGPTRLAAIKAAMRKYKENQKC